MNQSTIGPGEVVVAAAAAKINKDYFEFTNYFVETYLEHGEMDSYWRLRIVCRFFAQTESVLLAEHLEPDITGHTCYVIIEALKKSFARGLAAGKATMIETLHAKMCEAVGLTVAKSAEAFKSFEDGHAE